MSKTHIETILAAALGLPTEQSRRILREIASALVKLHPSSGRVVRDRESLLEFLQELAGGNKRAIQKLTSKTPYRGKQLALYSRAVARAFLDQAEIDAASGLSRGASVWVEVNNAAPGPRGEEIGPHTQSSPAPEADAGIESKADPVSRIRFFNTSNHNRGFGFIKPSEPSYSHVISSISPAGARPDGGLSTTSGSSNSGYGSSEDSDDYEFVVFENPADPAVVAGDVAFDSMDDTPRDANEYRVWFATNREPTEKRGKRKFSSERSRSVRYGYCDVYVPESHKIGSIGSSAHIRLLTWTDDRLKIRRTQPLENDVFWTSLKQQLAGVAENERHAVVFVHGYNVSFNEAAIRAAQLGYDLGIQGAMALFSWPSKGNAGGYLADGETIEASERAITDFLVDFAEKTGATAVHVIAHSMGNRGVLRAVNSIAQNAQDRTGLPFGNFILAAPDVDAETFMNLASAYRRIARRTTLYVSEGDKAVSLSRWLHDYPRVGFAPPISVFEGIDTVNVTNIDLTMLGHGYVAEAREVLSDMHSLIFDDMPPERRFGLRKSKSNSDEQYWTVKC